MTDLCAFCELLKAPQSHPTFITEFEHSVAFLDFDQEAYPGGSLLILKGHYEHLHLSPISLQQAVIPELVELTTAILKAFGGIRANHMSLGNGIAHIHWYIVPRYPNDLNAGHAPIYKPNYKKLADSEYQEMANRIAMEIMN
jgi:diadenosine tetraphosphate (Ap4A) HIT family hydrolase